VERGGLRGDGGEDIAQGALRELELVQRSVQAGEKGLELGVVWQRVVSCWGVRAPRCRLLVVHRLVVRKDRATDAALIRVEKAIGAGFTDEALTITCRDSEALLGGVTRGAGSSGHDGSPLRWDASNNQRVRERGGHLDPAVDMRRHD
jgi:hypothetical protein